MIAKKPELIVRYDDDVLRAACEDFIIIDEKCNDLDESDCDNDDIYNQVLEYWDQRREGAASKIHELDPESVAGTRAKIEVIMRRILLVSGATANWSYTKRCEIAKQAAALIPE